MISSKCNVRLVVRNMHVARSFMQPEVLRKLIAEKHTNFDVETSENYLSYDNFSSVFLETP